MKALAISVAMLCLCVIGYSLAYPTFTYRFRVTLNVVTPGGLKSGSSVMEVRHRQYPAWTTLGANTGQSSLSGDAIFVDLNGTKPNNLFGLLAFGPHGEIPDLYLLPGRAFASMRNANGSQFRGTAVDIARLPPGTKAGLSGDQIPVLLVFDDVANPTTARVAEPGNLEAVFGSGVRLHSATIEIVPSANRLGFGGEPVTRGIGRRLPWWEKPMPWLKSLDGRVFVDTRASGFKWNKSHFEQGT